MNSVDASCREHTLDGFFCVEISDLVASSVVGGALAGATATAYAFGDSSLALTTTKTLAKQFANGGSLAMGWGTAVASGHSPVASVSTFGTGNGVLAYTSTTAFSTTRNANSNVAIATGFVVAIDWA
ncbi:hypothetical protein [Chamaesiphon sp.]|uniref:hypothetical protein n=1 Tax=Chamaesiphon sp. TaxID=2814140 RepID=UPI0035939CA7